MNNIDNVRDDLEDWMVKWEKAQEGGIFDGLNTPPKTSPALSQFSNDIDYGGEFGSEDAAYWASTPKDVYVDPLENSLLQENVKRQKAGKNYLGKADIKEAVVGIDRNNAVSSNPTKFSTTVSDQDYQPIWFTQKDFENLENIKAELHSLQDKLNMVEGSGKSDKKLDSRINKMRERVDELSNELVRFVDAIDLPQEPS